jgi:hypothetical protein
VRWIDPSTVTRLHIVKWPGGIQDKYIYICISAWGWWNATVSYPTSKDKDVCTYIPGLPDFSWHNMPKRGKWYHIATTLPNGRKIHELAVLYSKWTKIFQPFPIQGPPKFTQIGIFSLKIYHLATLLQTQRVTHFYRSTYSEVKGCLIYFTSTYVGGWKHAPT